MGRGGMSRVERHRRWVETEGWRGRDGVPNRCEWCRRKIWRWRKRARLVRTRDLRYSNDGVVGRMIWVHERCGQHMQADRLLSK